jgi:hypothetical protein
MRKLLLSALALLPLIAGAQTAKPPLVPVWASTATPTTDIVKPSDSYIATGWPLSSTPPSRQYFNWFQNYTSAGISYILHRGISDWDGGQTYAVNDVVQSNGYLYQSALGNNTGNAPPSVASGINSNWDVIHVITAPLHDDSSRVASTDFVHNNYIPINGLFSQLSGSIAPSQVPLGAVNQWQAYLNISYGQLTGVPVSTSVIANDIVARDGSGYTYVSYLNRSSGNNENPPISQVIVQNGTDTFDRKAGFGYFQSQMNLANISGQVSAGQVPANAVTQYSPQVFTYNPFISIAGNGCTQIPGGIILMWGNSNPNGGTIGVAFPCGGFPHGVFSVTSNSTGIPTQSNISGWSTTSFTIHNTGGQSNWIAIGY